MPPAELGVQPNRRTPRPSRPGTDLRVPPVSSPPRKPRVNSIDRGHPARHRRLSLLQVWWERGPSVVRPGSWPKVAWSSGTTPEASWRSLVWTAALRWSHVGDPGLRQAQPRVHERLQGAPGMVSSRSAMSSISSSSSWQRRRRGTRGPTATDRTRQGDGCRWCPAPTCMIQDAKRSLAHGATDHPSRRLPGRALWRFRRPAEWIAGPAARRPRPRSSQIRRSPRSPRRTPPSRGSARW